MHGAVYDAVVIGAGPAGTATAREIARAGFSVLIVEEHRSAGEPSHCSGLVTPRTLDLAGLDAALVLNELRSAVIRVPSGKTLEIDGGRAHAFAVDRPGLDKALAMRAESAGAELASNTRFDGFERLEGCLRLRLRRRQQTFAVSTRLLIGADGAQSRVARSAGLRALRSEPVLGLGAEVRLARQREDAVQVFIGSEIAPGFFGWSIPLGDGRARLGLATSRGGHPIHYFQALLRRFPALFEQAEVIRLYGGPIPLRRLSAIYADNVMVVGDAAGHVKPTSGGGIYTALLGASLCARTAVRALRRDRLEAGELSVYEAAWQATMGAELRRGWALREMVLGLDDHELDVLVTVLRAAPLQRTIRNYGDIDFPSRLAAKLLASGPDLVRFARFLLRGSWREISAAGR